MMKKFALLVSLLLTITIVFAQAPPLINYQAVVRDVSGVVLANQEVVIEVTIVQGELTGDAVFTETHTVTTSVAGVVNLSIGSVNNTEFEAISWEASPFFLMIEVNGTLLGTTQILSVPFAFYANSAGNSFSGDYNDLVNVPENLDTDQTNDFSGDYNDLVNVPENLDTDQTDDFSGDYNDLLNKPEFQFFWADKDNDGFGHRYSAVYAPEAPPEYINNSDDCNDGNISINPSAEEVIDGIDNDCDDLIDCDDSDISGTFECLDTDGDGILNPADNCWEVANPDQADLDDDNIGDVCDPDIDGDDIPNAEDNCPTVANPDQADMDDDDIGDVCDPDIDGDGYPSDIDCDDYDPAINPGADEVCNWIDDDCDEEIDEDAIDPRTWYRDADNDGYGDETNSINSCDAPEGYVEDSSDCDDLDSGTHPGAVEFCDGFDNDCDGEIDEGAIDASTWYRDDDGDGFGTSEHSVTSCTEPLGYVSNSSDCDDLDSGTHPGAVEVCDAFDNDCDEEIDEGAIDASTWYRDADGDSYGDETNSIVSCGAPEGYVENSGDCNDLDPSIFPGALEIIGDEIDNDCDGEIDEEP